MDKTVEWQTLMSTGEGLLEELKKPTFRYWFHTLEYEVKRSLDRFIGHVLRKICWTGVNDAGKLVVACPQFGDSGSCIHISSKEFRAFAWILKDTEQSATFACLLDKYVFYRSSGARRMSKHTRSAVAEPSSCPGHIGLPVPMARSR
jgi:hypothetical protein